MSKDVVKQMIPHIEELIKKEKEHLDFLIKNSGDSIMIETSKNYLKHFELRLKQYNDY